MNYTIHQLAIFLKVVEKKSITKASEAMFMTQPAVSIQLKKLQEQFEIPLFEVVNRKTHITDFGYEVAASAQKIMDEIHQLSSKTMSFKGLLAGKLKIMSVSTGQYIIPYLLTDFLNQNKGVDLQLEVTNKNEVVSALENNTVDFALVSVLPSQLDLEFEDLIDNELYLVGKKKKKQTKKMDAKTFFNDVPIIFRESGSGTRTSMEEFLKFNGIKGRVKLEVTSNEAVKQAVLAGLGYSVMPKIGIHKELTENSLSIVPIKGLPIVTKWRLVWLKGKKLSPIASEYLHYIRSNKQNLIQFFT
jgi:DNA-binding transcriptional LysR family regulator